MTASPWFVPKPVTQRDASDPLQFSHCWGAVGAWLLAAATDGAARVTAKDFAKQAGGGSGRKTGSGTHEDIVNGLHHYGVKASLVRLLATDAAEILGKERRAVWAVATDYDAWPTPKDCMNGVVGPDVDHEVGWIGGDPGRAMNPLCVGDYQSIKLATLTTAAFKKARQDGHSRYIEVVRVFRQRPTTNIADRALIADQQDQLDQWAEYQASVKALAGQLLDLPVPK